MQVFFHDLAFRDLGEIFGWLETDSLSAAKRFEAEFTAAKEFVAVHPASGHPCGRFRRKNLNRFPFHFLYLVSKDGAELWIMVVRHDARHPGYGMRRRLVGE